jgi:hypothetical protein
MARRILLLASVVLLAASGRAWAEDPSVVPAGTVHTGDFVVLGRGAVVKGVLSGTVVSVLGSVRVAGRVEKDVIAVGGDIVVEAGAQVLGDVLAVGGTVRLPSGTTRSVGGRVLTIGELEAAFAAELQTSPLAASPVSGLLLAFRLVLLFLWLVFGLLLVRFVPRSVSVAAGFLPGRLATTAILGASAALSSALVSAFLLLVLPATAGLVVTALLLAILGAAKVFGLTAVFVAAGRRLARGAKRGSPLFGDPAALALGLALLGILSLVPVAGPLVWAIASLLGIGAALVVAARRAALRPVFEGLASP